MKGKMVKKHRILTKIITLVVVKGLILSLIPGAYCGEVFCQNSDKLSPHISIANIEVKNTFDLLPPTEEELYTRRQFFKRSGELALVGAGVLILGESFLAPYLLPKSGIGIAEAGRKEEEKFEVINQKPKERFDRIARVVNRQLTKEGAMDNVIKLFEGKKYKHITDTYKEIRPIIVSTGMDEDILYSIMLTETDLRGVITSKKSGAYGPLQVMEDTVINCNDTMARWEKQRNRPKAYDKVVELIGSRRIKWKKMHDFEYSFRVGAAVAYIKYNHFYKN